MAAQPRFYIAIDMKSFYASVECVARGYDPLTTNLLVADESRSDQTICLAVSPSLKAIGVPSRPRLFEAKQAIRKYELAHHTTVSYKIALPRMAEYERVSALIYSILLRHAAPEDVHVYSIDESFLDATPYLQPYLRPAKDAGVHPAHLFAMTIIRDILSTTGITATVGIGTNLYLAKVAMDIVAKKSPPDRDGVRIAELNEDSYKYLLWDHRPLTAFWMIGPGKARRLEQAGLYTMGDIARRSQWDEEWFYKTFGIDGEILIAHPYDEARTVFSEMIDSLCADLFSKRLVSPHFSWWVSYDHKSLEACPNYEGPLVVDFYGRLHPKHSGGSVRMLADTNLASAAAPLLLASFDAHTDSRLLFRRLGVCADDVRLDNGSFQMNLFVDEEAVERDRQLQSTLGEIRSKYGANSLFLGKNMREGATQLERNRQIGGHRKS